MEATAFITDHSGQPVDGQYTVRFALYTQNRETTDPLYDESDIDPGVGFRVKIDAPALDKDVEFNWLIVE